MESINLKDKTGKFLSVSGILEQFPEYTSSDMTFKFTADPLLNYNVIPALIKLKQKGRPKILFATRFPRACQELNSYMNSFVNMVNECYGEDLKFAILLGGTNDRQRVRRLGKVQTLLDIAKSFEKPPELLIKPVLALNEEYDIETPRLLSLFPPDKYTIRVKPQDTKKKRNQLVKQLQTEGYTVEREEISNPA